MPNVAQDFFVKVGDQVNILERKIADLQKRLRDMETTAAKASTSMEAGAKKTAAAYDKIIRGMSGAGGTSVSPMIRMLNQQQEAIVRTQEKINQARAGIHTTGASRAAQRMFSEEAAAVRKNTEELNRNVQVRTRSRAAQYGTAPGAAANVRETTKDVNQLRFGVFQLTSGFQDAAIAFEMMGNTTAGWSMAMRGASNNLGVLLSTMGTTAAVGGTLALAVGPAIISWLMNMADRTKNATEALQKFIDLQKQQAGLARMQFAEKAAPERRRLRLQAITELIQQGAIAEPTQKRLTELYIKEREIPGAEITTGAQRIIAREQEKLIKARKFELERWEEGRPIYTPEQQAKILKEELPDIRIEAERRILADEKLAEEYKNAQNASLEAEAEARREIQKDIQKRRDEITELQGKTRAEFERAAGAKVPRQKKSELMRQRAREAAEELGYSQGGIAGSQRSTPGPTDTVPAMLTPGEEVLRTDDPRHIANIRGYQGGGIAARRRAIQTPAGRAAALASLAERRSRGHVDIDRAEYWRQKTAAAVTAREAQGLPTGRGFDGSTLTPGQGQIIDPRTGEIYGREHIQMREIFEMGKNFGMKGFEVRRFVEQFGVAEAHNRMRSSFGQTASEQRYYEQKQRIRDYRARQAGQPQGIYKVEQAPPQAQWPYGPAVAGPPTWREAARRRVQQREAQALGRIPSSARIGGAPGSAGIGTYQGGSGIQGFQKKAPWETKFNTIETGPGAAATPAFRGSAFHAGVTSEQGIHGAARSAEASARRQLEQDLARYQQEAMAQRKKQLQEELEYAERMRKMQKSEINRNVQL
jgi:hypothetical protein